MRENILDKYKIQHFIFVPLLQFSHHCLHTDSKLENSSEIHFLQAIIGIYLTCLPTL